MEFMMDYEEVKEAAERGMAITEWLASIESEKETSGLRCNFLDRDIFFDSEKAQELFVAALKEELNEIDRYIRQLSK